MIEVLEKLADDEKKKLKKMKQPSWLEPMLATLTKKRFSNPDWLYERKLDGERCLAFKKGNDVRLRSRNNKDLNANYPEVVDILEKQKIDSFIIDGEIVAFEGDVTSFSRLQGRMHIVNEEEARTSKIAVYYYIFDIMYIDSYDLSDLPLDARKHVLKLSLSFNAPLRFTIHRNGEGEKFYQEACRKKWEGIIAKKSDSIYVNSRSSSWLKFKCANQQEFAIGGYTQPEGNRIAFGAILIGYYDNGDFVYAGKVGAGFDNKILHDLGKKMHSLERKTSPFDRGEPSKKGVHWVKPELVAEIGFTEWTDDNKLRHPRYLGSRRDKKASRVVKEK